MFTLKKIFNIAIEDFKKPFIDFYKDKELQKLLLKIFLLFFLAMLLIMLLISLDKIYRFSEKLNKKLLIPMMGKDVIFPAMNDTVLVGGLIVVILSMANAFAFMFYRKYKYKMEFVKDRQENSKYDLSKETKFQAFKKFLPILLFVTFHGFFDFFYEELSISLEKSLNGKFDKKYLITIYLILLGLIILDQFVEVVEVKVVDKYVSTEKEEEDADKNDSRKAKIIQWIKKHFLILVVISIISFALLMISIGINKIDMSFEWTPTINGDKITLFSNKDNIFVLSIVAIILIPIMTEYIFPAINKAFEKNKDGMEKSFKEKCRIGFSECKDNIISFGFVKSLMLSIFMAVTVDVSIFSINSLQSMSFSNPAFLLPLSLLCVASIFFVGLTIKQFYDDDKEPSKNIGDFNQNGIGGFSPD